MSFLQWGDVPTWGLLVGAGVTAWFAKRAYDAQGTELKTLQEQADDQAKQLKLQSDQLEEQRKVNERELAVLDLQQKDLAATLDQRRSEQAALVFFWAEYLEQDPRAGPAATNMDPAEQVKPPVPVIAVYVKNTSRQPVYDITIRLGGNKIGELRILLPELQEKIFYGPGSEPDAEATLEFRDASSSAWERDDYGNLTYQGEEYFG